MKTCQFSSCLSYTWSFSFPFDIIKDRGCENVPIEPFYSNKNCKEWRDDLNKEKTILLAVFYHSQSFYVIPSIFFFYIWGCLFFSPYFGTKNITDNNKLGILLLRHTSTIHTTRTAFKNSTDRGAINLFFSWFFFLLFRLSTTSTLRCTGIDKMVWKYSVVNEE